MLKFKGHPLHIALVHFPIACFVLSFIADLALLFFTLPYVTVFSFYLVIAGCCTGFLALATGFADLIAIKDNEAVRIALIHGGLNLIWVCAFSFLAIPGLRKYPDLIQISFVQLVIKGICVFGLFVSNYLGGQLILKHKVLEKSVADNSINSKPN